MTSTKKLREQIWLIFVFLFGLSLFVSKSLLTLTTVVLILWSFIDSQQRNLWLKNKKVIGIMALFPLALFLNLFSLGGVDSVVKIILSWYWPLIAAPILCLFHDTKGSKSILTGFILGLLIATLYALFLFTQRLSLDSETPFLSDNYRIASFWDIGRWGFFAGFAVLTLFFILHEKLSDGLKKKLLILFGLTFVTFILSNARAPLIALIIIFSLVSFTSIKFFKNTLVLFLISFYFLLFNPALSERVKSIFSVSVNSEKITSTHKSNASRLNMWKVAFDFYKEQPFFGTGFENTKAPLKIFLQKQDRAYLESFTAIEFSYNDQHSSYVNSLVHMGIIFFALCWSFIFYIYFKYFKFYLKTKDPILRYHLAGLTYCLIIFIFYSGFSSYESIVFFALLTLIGEKSQAQTFVNNLAKIF